MKRLLPLLFLFSSCLGQYLPEVEIRVAETNQVVVAVMRAIETADLDGDGVVRGRAESTALWNNLLTAITLWAPPPAT